MSNTVVVDDANSRILYSGSWQARNGTSLDLNGTVRGVVGSGSTVTGNATFTFTGEEAQKFEFHHIGSECDYARHCYCSLWHDLPGGF